ncbi:MULTISPECIES: bifunctional UDP-3-O-[3-hydroxymyristoyl] N-acetylglucosamine deacetylase/3-hydroxyacyl-ACP dehydratase [Persicobacter]|uniref:Multifunctional fusion protein n=1 Tax=Persicobacter diffluens TaxID=981 RepID=A0AAN4W0B7_9BACT|nr:bifunctional UDP-3-O-[3-hydroxymyristoyl] N-acetylglucosamine deacetylase/3-hydroxyacyl-ACP dehydratase [Persicobacter sp. CCB-QB2]GJM61595.1 3-hydroxyacyl-[acyl-carrier-protein] dehydratase FabZ [Persicobacter diffluens]
MNTKQHTIKKPVSVSGVGLHTGQMATMTFLPAEAGHGYKFQRVDLEGQPIVEADVDYVVDTSRGTTLQKGEARVNTVEHVLAALVGLQIDNALIQLDGPEPPIADGSSILFVEALKDSGLEEQNALRNYFEIPKSVYYSDKSKDIDIAAMPADDYRLTVMVDYNSQILGSQHASITHIKQFEKEIAPCRTFVFLHELEMLYEQGLIRGGDVDNAVVIVDRELQPEQMDRLQKIFNKEDIVVNQGFLNNVELRYKNEPARHKLLDVIGDLALAGRPLKGQIMAARPGHAANVAFARKLKKMMQETHSNIPHYDPKMPAVCDINKISEMLPHRFPFLMVDKIFHLDSKYVAGIKNVSINEPIFTGHFPDNPVFPGVLMIEALAQTGGILVLGNYENPENHWTYFLGVDKVKFRKMVKPGDTLILQCELISPIKRGIAKMKGEAYVGNDLVCEGEMTARIVPKD